jgi:hypothetical protein
MNSISRSTSLALLVTTLVVAGCSSGSNNNPPTGGAATGAPTISAINDQTVAQDSSTNPITFTVSDPDSDLATVTLSVIATNPSLLSSDGIVLSGSGGNRAITLTPNEGVFGPSRITIVATDPQGATSSQSFMLQVTTMRVSFKSFATQTVAADENSQPQTVSGLSFADDANDPGTFDSFLNTASNN